MTILPGGDPTKWGLSEVKNMIGNVIQLAMSLAAGVAVIYIILAGFQYFTAFGNEEKANKAKQTLTWAIAGLVVIILAKVIVSEVWRFVTNRSLDFWF